MVHVEGSNMMVGERLIVNLPLEVSKLVYALLKGAATSTLKKWMRLLRTGCGKVLKNALNKTRN